LTAAFDATLALLFVAVFAAEVVVFFAAAGFFAGFVFFTVMDFVLLIELCWKHWPQNF
jgi:hypothetical protein